MPAHPITRAGLLRRLPSASDDELAGILAHEMAHVVARHTAEQITQSGLATLAVIVIESLMDVRGSGLASLDRLFRGLPNSRAHEREADKIGVELASRACFDPLGLKRALRVCPWAPSLALDVTLCGVSGLSRLGQLGEVQQNKRMMHVCRPSKPLKGSRRRRVVALQTWPSTCRRTQTRTSA